VNPCMLDAGSTGGDDSGGGSAGVPSRSFGILGRGVLSVGREELARGVSSCNERRERFDGDEEIWHALSTSESYSSSRDRSVDGA
jgi:hypothetical protein